MADSQVNRLSRLVFEAAPAAWLLLFFLFVARAWLKSGYLPSYSNPDPKNLEMSLHHGLLWLLLYILPWLILGYGLTLLRSSFAEWKVGTLLVFISIGTLITTGPDVILWPAIWTTPVVSGGVILLVLKCARPRMVKWFYAVNLAALNVWLFVDPLQLMEWFYD